MNTSAHLRHGGLCAAATRFGGGEALCGHAAGAPVQVRWLVAAAAVGGGGGSSAAAPAALE